MLSAEALQHEKKSEALEEELPERTGLADAFHGLIKMHSFQGSEWLKMDSSVDFASTPCTRFVSLGADPNREKLFIDTNSLEMIKIKRQAELKCFGRGVMAILEIVNNIVNSLVTESENEFKITPTNIEERLKKFLANKRSQLQANEVICAHLDEFIKEKILVCRHQAPIATILLAHLVKQNILPQGIVRQYRSLLKQDDDKKGAHAWAVFRDIKSNKLWLCDPTWQVVAQVENQIKYLILKGYGNVSLNKMLRRLELCDILELLCQQLNEFSNLFHFHSDKGCYITPGTEKIPGQHLRVEFSEESHMMAFIFALQQQNIFFRCGLHGKPLNPFVMIFTKDNPAIISLKIDNLCDDFKRKLMQDEHSQDKSAQKKDCDNKNNLSHAKTLTYSLNMSIATIPRSYSEDNVLIRAKKARIK
ncbi:MAG: hypothetical protein BGO43_02225 [Gammaproteobacteria bacterium 39-13]|nr:hypothetical protein [Gammaproteobacteria bacterium]OJV87368.1 MAG: hypothetical protein BGO43_02225 [Gammaproteobacteria bacterium 39-13]